MPCLPADMVCWYLIASDLNLAKGDLSTSDEGE